MAGFADSTPAPLALPAPAARDALSRPSLPNGPCNYRDLAFGDCGCDQFWDKCSAEIHDGSKEHRPSSERSTWCVCGHHACFHLKEPRVPELRQPPHATVVCRVHAKCDGRICQLQTGSQSNASKGVPSVDGERQSPEGSQAIHNGQLRKSPSGLAQQLLSLGASPTNTPARSEHGRRTPSQASTSGLPRVPSVCLLSNDRRPAANSEVRQDVNQSRHSVTGLGLSLLNLDHLGNSINHQQSVSPTVPDDVNIDTLPIEPYGGQDASATKPISVPDEHEGASSQARGALDQIVEFNHNLQLDIGSDTIPNTLNPEDFIQSATEIATPSNANTPDLEAADCAVSEGKKFIETLTRLTSDMEQRNGSPSRPTTSATSAPSPQLLLTNSPGTPQEQLQQILQAASPKAFQKLVSYLAPLHSLLNSIPNVASTMQEFGSRLDLIENGSFNYVQPDELQHSLDMYEGRILELENRMDEHDRLHQAIDADQSSNSLTRRRVATITDSFGSNQSFQSTTSSALVLAAMDRKDMENEIGGIKDRLEMLEAAALPSAINPWEVEIVLLPWGHDLRGIWFSPDEPMHDSAKTTTQDSEEWTQARSSSMTHGPRPLLPNTSGILRDTDSSPHPSGQMQQKGSLFSDSESGWSSQAISDWASGSVDDWLFPKACGKTNMVYKRLQSRGFIRDVKLSGASARDIQVALANAFSDLLEHLRYTEEEEDQIISSYPGLRASFIPLRKVFKESKLRFLTPAEMSSSALWSAQFLASGVMMRVSGGKKRLYVTQREAYIQQSDQKGSSWTWPEVRQLPRFSPDQDCQMEGTDKQNQLQVAEADAKEACWSYVEAYDAPPASVNSSFGSNHSVQLSMRPADRQWRRSITPSSILKNRQLQPISPLSENHPQRPRAHNRTVSTSAVEQAIPGSSKRRLEASPVKQSSVPHTVSRAPSMSLARLKRRRVTNSSSPKPDHMQEAQITFWNNTPRRSREPQSPFFSSTPGLPRSNSDVASRPSQRSIAVVGKSTPFAYATPHSGPFIGGPGFEEYGPGGGDTEPDDEDGSYDNDDGEQSWGGVTDGEDISAAVSEEPASFSGDDSGFGTENGGHDDDDDDQFEEDDGFGAQRRHVDEDDEDDEEEDGDVFDTLLEVLQH